ncbi:MAG: glycosyl transferase [Alphaproteobacteria bacterium]|nr:glycosyl transferase [Alphaproteobacteria bacterium]
MTDKPRVFYYVQHLLGVGHVFRTMRIVSVLVDRGFQVDLVHGGERLPNFDSCGADVHFLPSLVSSKGDFSNLLAADGKPATEEYKTARRDLVLTIFANSIPDIIVTEAFPFGRRQMHFELLPLMDAAKSLAKPPMIFASVRDILQEGNKTKKDRQTVEFVHRYFDGVLVHGDPDLIRLDATFPFASEIADCTYYTGIVTPEGGRPAEETFDVVVSAGGGLLGRELIASAVEAKAISNLKEARWCILTGPYLEASEYARLEALAGGDVAFRPFIPDLHCTLAKAQLSISLAGYNTVADIMAAGCRAIISPQWNDKETEQLHRAQLLSKRGLVEMIGHEEKTASGLCAAIDRVMDRPVPDWTSVQRHGGEKTADILSRAVTGADLSIFR